MTTIINASPLFRILLAAAFCCTGGIASAQEPQKPGPEHDHLKTMVGNWDAVMEMGGQKSKAKATYKTICSGMWIASDFESELGGVPYQGNGMDGYDQLKKKYVGYWFDSVPLSRGQILFTVLKAILRSSLSLAFAN